MVGREHRGRIGDRVVVQPDQRVLRVLAEPGVAVRAVIDLVAAVVRVAEEQPLVLPDAVVHARDVVAEVVLAQVRAGDEVVGDRRRRAHVRRRDRR